jgi:hypothetical protein
MARTRRVMDSKFTKFRKYSYHCYLVHLHPSAYFDFIFSHLTKKHAMEGPSSTSPQGVTLRPSYSCTRCSARKVRCDRQRPCGACTRHEVECVFKPPQAPGEKRKRAASPGQDLVSRLKHYERLLQERGIDLSLPDASTSESAALTKTQVISGKRQYKLLDK